MALGHLHHQVATRINSFYNMYNKNPKNRKIYEALHTSRFTSFCPCSSCTHFLSCILRDISIDTNHMGANLSLLAPQAQTVALRSYVDVLADYRFLHVINESRYLKTIQAYHTTTGTLTVIKLYIKPPLENIRLNRVSEKLATEALLLVAYPNLLSWHKIIETDLGGYLIRQLVRSNLYDRMSLRPFLKLVEKAWIVFQLLKAVELLHDQLHTCHGDIKTENVLLSSSNWVVLTDFSQHVKPVFLPDDNPSEFVFYFDSSARRSCYVAPERFQGADRSNTNSGNLTPEMDLFSLGCVICELYADGEPTFSLSDLYRYKKGESEPSLRGIRDAKVREMILKLILRDPTLRPLAAAVLDEYRDLVFPGYFYDHLYSAFCDLNRLDQSKLNKHILESDLRIERIWHDFSSYYGVHGVRERLALPGSVGNSTNSDWDSFKIIAGSPHYRLALPGTIPFVVEPGQSTQWGFLMVLEAVCLMLALCCRPINRIRACKLILACSEFLPDDVRLDRLLPFLCLVVDEFVQSLVNTDGTGSATESARVAVVAIRCISDLVAMCRSVSALNVLVFSDYLLPRLKSVAFMGGEFREEGECVKAVLAAEMANLAVVAERMLNLAVGTENTDLLSGEINKTIEHLAPALKSIALSSSGEVFDSLSIAVRGPDDSSTPVAPTEEASADIAQTGLLGESGHSNVPKKEQPKNGILLKAGEAQDDEDITADTNNIHGNAADKLKLITSSTSTSATASAIRDITESLLTDSSANVRIALVSNILPLCQVFGVDRTMDIILPHLITYLNDGSYQLRLAFIASLSELGRFIGALSFEQYLLPLLFQTLQDPEPMIVLKVLEIFNQSVAERLINPALEFNALSIYKELLGHSMPLLLQPNPWIRQSVLSLVLLAAKNLSTADKFCFLYPIIQSYLSYDLAVLSWSTLYPCLTPSISRQVYDGAGAWLANSTSRSMFWRHANVSLLRAGPRARLVSFSKDMGRLVYVRDKKKFATARNGNLASLDIPLSSEDRLWVAKLKALGLDERDLWKIFALKEHIARDKAGTTALAAGDTRLQTEFEFAASVAIPPRTVLSKVSYRAETVPVSAVATTICVIPRPDDALLLRSRSGSTSFVLPYSSHARAQLLTVKATALGEMEPEHWAPKKHGPSVSTQVLSSDTLKSKSRPIVKILSTSNDQIISSIVRHEADAANPYVSTFLQSVRFDPGLSDFTEFGSSESPPSGHQDFSLKESIAARVSYASPLISLVCTAAACTSEFFVTGSSTGIFRAWDPAQLERSISGRDAHIAHNLNLPIVAIVSMPHRFVFAVATGDGRISLLRVHVTRGKSRRITKYSRISVVRTLKLKDGIATAFRFVGTRPRTFLVVALSLSVLSVYDIITMETVKEMQNPVILGAPTSLLVSRDLLWLLVGTSDGVLCLWDIRFLLLVSAWTVKSSAARPSAPIRSIDFVDWKLDSSLFALTGGTNSADITVWDVPSFQCREIFSANAGISPEAVKYELQKVDISKEPLILSLLAEFGIDTDPKPSEVCSNTQVSTGIIAAATTDCRVIIWNTNNILQSTSLLTSGALEFHAVQVTLTLTMAYEKLLSPQRTRNKLAGALAGISVLSGASPRLVAIERNGTVTMWK